MRNIWTTRKLIIGYILFIYFSSCGVLFYPEFVLSRSLCGAQMIHSGLEFVPYLGRPSCELAEPLLQIYFDAMLFWMRGVANVVTDLG